MVFLDSACPNCINNNMCCSEALFTVGDSLKQVALPFSCVSSLLEGILAFWQNMMFQTHPDFSCPKTWNQVSPGFFSSNSRE